MALRIRKDGRVLCAAMHPSKVGDTYLGDGLHYRLSVEEKVLVTEPHEQHRLHGEWWWVGNIPEGVEIDTFYSQNEKISQRKDGECFEVPTKKRRRMF